MKNIKAIEDLAKRVNCTPQVVKVYDYPVDLYLLLYYINYYGGREGSAAASREKIYQAEVTAS